MSVHFVGHWQLELQTRCEQLSQLPALVAPGAQAPSPLQPPQVQLAVQGGLEFSQTLAPGRVDGDHGTANGARELFEIDGDAARFGDIDHGQGDHAGQAEFEHLRESLQKLALNDSSFHFEPENSTALGFGFRCGFLGLLHLEIVRERLAREFNLDLITTAPSVVYKLHLTNGELLELYNPVDMPDVTRIASIEEPWIKATIFVPGDYLGSVITLCTERRGEQVDLTWVGTRAMLVYKLPLNEVVYDFYDRLKSISRGYASFDYHIEGYREGDLVKVNILVNGEEVDALSMLVTRTAAEARGRQICERLKDLIPRQLFAVPIQAAIGGKIIARETLSAMRKDVTAKCYGGDITRKRKLLDKQKEGKKRLREFGSVEIPQSAFIEALRMKDR